MKLNSAEQPETNGSRRTAFETAAREVLNHLCQPVTDAGHTRDMFSPHDREMHVPVHSGIGGGEVILGNRRHMFEHFAILPRMVARSKMGGIAVQNR